MSKIKKIYIIVNSNKSIGNGHFVRSNNLYQILNKKFKIQLFNNKNNIFLEKIFKNKKDKNLILLDSEQINIKLLNQLSKKNVIITFDNFQEFKSHYNISIFQHKKVSSIKKNFVGTKYINLKKDILDYKNYKSNNKKKDFLISIGSSDIKNQGLKISKMLHTMGYKLTLIQGSFKEYNKDNISNLKNLKIINNVKKMAILMHDHKYLITNGGTTLFEANFLNKKTYVLPQTEREEKVARYFYLKKQISGYGFLKFNKTEVKNLIKFKIKKPNIIDGKGSERIIKIISKLMK